MNEELAGQIRPVCVLDIIEDYFLEKYSFLFCFVLFVRSVTLYFNKIENLIKLVGRIADFIYLCILI